MLDSNGDVDMATKLLKRTNIVARGLTSEKMRAMVTQDLRYVLIRLSSNDSFIRFGQFFTLPFSELEPIRAGVNQTDISLVRSATIPDDVRSRVRIALAILPGDRFVFLDWDLWVNSYKMVDFAHQSASPRISSKPPKHHGKEGDHLVQRTLFCTRRLGYGWQFGSLLYDSRWDIDLSQRR